MAAALDRLRTAAEFDRVYRDGRTFHGRSLLLRVAPAAAPGPSAFGFVVSTRVSRSAVVRNRIRRRAREFVRSQTAQLVSDRAVAVIAKPPAATRTSAELREELSGLFKQATLIR